MIFTLATGNQNKDAHLLNSRSNGENVYNLTAKGHKLYVAVDDSDNIVVVDNDDKKPEKVLYVGSYIQTEIIMKCV